MCDDAEFWAFKDCPPPTKESLKAVAKYIIEHTPEPRPEPYGIVLPESCGISSEEAEAFFLGKDFFKGTERNIRELKHKTNLI